MNLMKASFSSQVLSFVALSVCFLLCTSKGFASAKENGTTLLEDIKKYDGCITQSIFSFLYPSSSPPKTENDFKAVCKSQSEGFKCLKEKTKGTVPILRRGVLAMVSTRQRHHRRYCTNLESEHSKRFLQGTKCFMEKRLKNFREVDAELILTLGAIMRKNYNDASLELKQLCCSFFNYKKHFHEAVGNECASHKGMADDLLQAIVVDDLTLVCEDDEKLSKVCPKLEKIDLEPLKRDPTFKVGPGGQSGSAMALYLFATLGEPNEDLSMLV